MLPENRITPLNRNFVAHFGEMGSRWGLNRGNRHAYFVISPRTPVL
jgi:DNA-binding transcriptional regulator GbsR (MarR family)